MKCNYKKFTDEKYADFAQGILDNYVASGKKDIVFVGIGSPKFIGDTLAPFANSIVEDYKMEINYPNVYIYGTLNNPIHATNLDSQMEFIYKQHPDSFIIGIDASVGNTIGEISLTKKPIKPGKGMGKELQTVGDMSLICVVTNEKDEVLGHTISLALVKEMAITVSNIISSTIATLQLADELYSNGYAELMPSEDENMNTDVVNSIYESLNKFENKNNTKIRITPKQIKEYLDEVMIGQEEAKKKVAVEVYEHYLRINNKANLIEKGQILEKSNILITGLTGTGKTFMMQKLAEFLDVPIYIQDCTKLTASGYVGDDIENCLKGLYQASNCDINKAQNGIIILDEIDKIGRKGENVSITRDVGGESVQQGLLKILEGSIVNIPSGQRQYPNEDGVKIDTSNILFVGIGSFEGIEDIVKRRLNKGAFEKVVGFGRQSEKAKELDEDEIRLSINREDLTKYGMLPELLGRFSIVTNFRPLHKNDLINIMKLKKGLFNSYKTEFELEGKELKVDESLYEKIADKALKEKVGARGLKAIIKELMNDIVFNMPDEDKKVYELNSENVAI